MRVTAILQKLKMPRGHIFRGKYRLVKRVDDKAKQDLVGDFRREEYNMLLLRNPYLTIEQSAGHAKELKKDDKWHEEFVKKNVKFPEHVKLEQRLCHLRFGENWE